MTFSCDPAPNPELLHTIVQPGEYVQDASGSGEASS